MKIRRVQIHENLYGNGLQNISLDRLGDVVVLSGKNGAGKSRVLHSIMSHASRALPAHTAMTMERELERERVNLRRQESALTDIENAKAIDNTSKSHLNNQRAHVASLRGSIEENESRISASRSIEIEGIETADVVCVNFLPKSTALTDDRTLDDLSRDRLIQAVYTLGPEGLSEGTTSLIRQIQSKQFESSHHQSEASPEEKDEHAASHEELRALIQRLLGAQLKRSKDGYPFVFNRHPVDARLSAGQSLLLQICSQLFAQGAALKDAIIFLDEPENHLHPGVCIDVLEEIRKAAPSCQIWIATHSLPVISYYASETLLFVSEGSVKYAGSVPEQVFKALLGDDVRTGRLRDFLSLPAIHAMNRFGAECLLPPTIAGISEKDAQTDQIRSHLAALRDQSPASKLRVLDYGAGKGRLLENLASDWPTSLSTLDYVAFDAYPSEKAECLKTIEAILGGSRDRYFESLHDLKGRRGSGTFDVVILCNVLHEIDPATWTTLFGADGELVSLLSTDGVFLFVEDEEIPVGENAHAYGFIVFDTEEFRELFDIQDSETFIHSDHREDGRLKAHIVTRAQASRMSTATRRAALQARVRRAGFEIAQTRNSGASDYRSGRKHAFWVHQFANASLALKEL